MYEVFGFHLIFYELISLSYNSLYKYTSPIKIEVTACAKKGNLFCFANVCRVAVDHENCTFALVSAWKKKEKKSDSSFIFIHKNYV